MGTQAIRRLQLNEVFKSCKFVHTRRGHYSADEGWYPLLGLPGSLDIKLNAVLFCSLEPRVESEVQKACLNGVIQAIHIHRSARVNGPNGMLMLATDLIRKIEICQIPLMSVVELDTFIDAARAEVDDQLANATHLSSGSETR